MHILVITVLHLLAISLFVTAQEERTRCNTMTHLDRLTATNPSIQSDMQKLESSYTMYHERDTSDITSLNISIPVVVHIVYNTQEQNLIDAFVETQIDVLNEDFRRLNPDRSQTLPQFQSVAADAGITFFLATTDPHGNPTTGITRTSTSVTLFTDDDKVKYTSFGGKDGWRSDKYLNVWVCNLEKYLGYAQFPHGGPKATDGVVIHYEVFGRPGISPIYGLGRTATHEVGHWLNLLHVWGSGGCDSDDFVSDTPQASDPHYDCFLESSSCGGTNMIQNYMDYTKDNCVNLFTQGQVERMRPLFAPGGPREKILHYNSFCDNGIIEEGEACDDGNSIDGDGCSSSCNIEQGFKCKKLENGTSECNTICPLLFHDDFEEGLSWNKWVPSLFGWQTVTNYDSTSGIASAFVPDQSSSSNYILATQPIKLPKTGAMYLLFNMKIRTELGMNGRCPDGARVILSNDKFTSIRTLTSFTTPYTAIHPLFSGVSWCSYSEYELVSEWKNVFIDITSYNGQQVQIGFQFATDEQQGGFGWLLDDVQIIWNYLSCGTYKDDYGIQLDTNMTSIPYFTSSGPTINNTAYTIPPMEASTWHDQLENSTSENSFRVSFLALLALLVTLFE